tara:strand:- start:236 stop:838 length:603 start_codon:yes stop_codon:yes gene_type:complete
MKKLLAIIVLGLLWCNTTQADDISDFQIEGMSIGDSALDFFSEKEIEDNIRNDYYKYLPTAYQKIYKAIEFVNLPRFKIYDNVSMDFLMKDNKFINKTVNGILFIDNAKECHSQQKKVDKELLEIFKNIHRETNENNHSFDKTGNSKTKAINYWFDSGDLVTVICTDWSDEITKTYGWSDNLAVEIKSKEYNQFLNEAYK